DDIDNTLSQQAQQRLEQLRLLLIAHHLQHGEYPATLDELVPYIDPELLATVTVDPYSGQPFQYASRYYELATWGDTLWEEYARTTDVPPMIWSIGQVNARKTHLAVDPSRYV